MSKLTSTGLARCGCLYFVMAVFGCGGSRTTEQTLRPSELHVMADSDAEAYAIAYDARGRGAYIVQRREQEQTTSGGSSQRQVSGFRICAEPAPDVAADLSSEATRALELQVAATYQAIEAQLGLNNQRTNTATSRVVDVAERTEIVLVLRSAMYRICELSLNGTISDADAKAMFASVLQTVQFMSAGDHLPALISTLTAESAQLTPEVREEIVRTILAISLTRMASNPGTPPALQSVYQAAAQQMLQQLSN